MKKWTIFSLLKIGELAGVCLVVHLIKTIGWYAIYFTGGVLDDTYGWYILPGLASISIAIVLPMLIWLVFTEIILLIIKKNIEWAERFAK